MYVHVACFSVNTLLICYAYACLFTCVCVCVLCFVAVEDELGSLFPSSAHTLRDGSWSLSLSSLWRSPMLVPRLRALEHMLRVCAEGVAPEVHRRSLLWPRLFSLPEAARRAALASSPHTCVDVGEYTAWLTGGERTGSVSASLLSSRSPLVTGVCATFLHACRSFNCTDFLITWQHMVFNVIRVCSCANCEVGSECYVHMDDFLLVIRCIHRVESGAPLAWYIDDEEGLSPCSKAGATEKRRLFHPCSGASYALCYRHCCSTSSALVLPSSL